MPAKPSQTAADWAAREYQEALEVADQEECHVELRKVNLRLTTETISLLDFLAQKLRHSRSHVAEELLTRAVEEAVCVVGIPTDEDGFYLSLVEREQVAA